MEFYPPQPFKKDWQGQKIDHRNKKDWRKKQSVSIHPLGDLPISKLCGSTPSKLKLGRTPE